MPVACPKACLSAYCRKLPIANGREAGELQPEMAPKQKFKLRFGRRSRQVGGGVGDIQRRFKSSCASALAGKSRSRTYPAARDA
jgi:hypothetical protein